MSFAYIPSRSRALLFLSLFASTLAACAHDVEASNDDDNNNDVSTDALSSGSQFTCRVEHADAPTDTTPDCSHSLELGYCVKEVRAFSSLSSATTTTPSRGAVVVIATTPTGGYSPFYKWLSKYPVSFGDNGVGFTAGDAGNVSIGISGTYDRLGYVTHRGTLTIKSKQVFPQTTSTFALACQRGESPPPAPPPYLGKETIELVAPTTAPETDCVRTAPTLTLERYGTFAFVSLADHVAHGSGCAWQNNVRFDARRLSKKTDACGSDTYSYSESTIEQNHLKWSKLTLTDNRARTCVDPTPLPNIVVKFDSDLKHYTTQSM